MSTQLPIVLNMNNNNAVVNPDGTNSVGFGTASYAILFDKPCTVLGLQLRSGSCFATPIMVDPSVTAPTALTVTPAPAAGQKAKYWHMTIAGEQRTKGVDPQSFGGQVAFAPPSLIYGVTIWRVGDGEIEIWGN